MKVFLKGTFSILILALASVVAWHFYTTKPQAKKRAKARHSIPLVQSIAVQPHQESVFFETSGTVIPAKKLVLRAEVEGRIVEQHRELVPGGILHKDELVIRLDARDYRFQIKERQAELATAEYELAVEQGKQAIARQEWQVLAREMNKIAANQELALRKPHLRHAQARITAAKARLEAAQLAEQRTVIRAPFTGIIVQEEVEQGQFIGKQSAIATLVASDVFWVQVAVPLFLVERLRFPGHSDGSDLEEPVSSQGSRVEIMLEREQGAPSVVRQGRVLKLLPDLDPKGRMARLLISLPDPLCLGAEQVCQSEEKILLESFVRVRLEAGELEDVFVLPEKALRTGNRLWLVNTEGVLSFREAQVRWRRAGEVLVDAESGPDERVIISHLQSPVPGMQVREEQSSRKKQDEPDGHDNGIAE
jgi:RND family efflux transporter MFP subunit